MAGPAPNNNETQRELEQRALRNVRGLVDKIEDSDAHDSGKQRRYLVGFVVGGLIVVLLLAWGLATIGHRGEEHVIEGAKPAAPASR